jgi:hypothetical protein
MKAERRLIIVTDIIEIAGRGILPWPVVPHALIGSEQGERLQPGDQLELRRPDGSVTRVKLCGLEWPSPGKGGLVLRLENSVTKQDLPLGTEIWRVSGPVSPPNSLFR